MNGFGMDPNKAVRIQLALAELPIETAEIFRQLGAWSDHVKLARERLGAAFGQPEALHDLLVEDINWANERILTLVDVLSEKTSLNALEEIVRAARGDGE